MNKNKEKPVETTENLSKMLKKAHEDAKYLIPRAKRLKKLLARTSSKKWSTKKVEKMSKRLAVAEEESTFIEAAIDQIAFRISQVGDT